jgi:hypothetical protein
MKAYEGDYSYESLYAYMNEAEDILSSRSNKATLKVDAIRSAYIRANGKDALLEQKHNHYNSKLEEFVTGADQLRMVDVIDDHIVPRTGLIFLTPQNKFGQAPFYSCEKVLGSWHVKTLWFNMAVMLLMSIIVALMLFTDCPGRFVRKGNQ